MNTMPDNIRKQDRTTENEATAAASETENTRQKDEELSFDELEGVAGGGRLPHTSNDNGTGSM